MMRVFMNVNPQNFAIKNAPTTVLTTSTIARSIKRYEWGPVPTAHNKFLYGQAIRVNIRLQINVTQTVTK
jgi:hypothetical protein